MTPNEVRQALDTLRCDAIVFAREVGVSERTVRRWLAGGATGAAKTTLRLALKLDAYRLGWREGEVPIRLGDNGIHFLEHP